MINDVTVYVLMQMVGWPCGLVHLAPACTFSGRILDFFLLFERIHFWNKFFLVFKSSRA